MSKLKRQIMQALNIKIRDIQGQTKPIHDFYINNLDNILNYNINNIVANIININFYLLKQIISNI